MNKQKLTKVFIVDDNYEAVELLRHLLEHDYSVEVVGTAGDAEEAASQITQANPDLIFLDVELPTMSGLEFCTMIQNELKPETKVVFYQVHARSHPAPGLRLPAETSHEAGAEPCHDPIL